VYVVYVTFYRGNKMPPFYIGSTSDSRILKGYNGSPRSKEYRSVWRSERRKNPNLFRTVVLKGFETHLESVEHEKYLQVQFHAVENPMFINMSYANRGFGRDVSGKNNPMYGVHLGAWNKGQSLPEEIRRKMGFPHPTMIGRPKSEETKEKLRKPHKTHKTPIRNPLSEVTKRKIVEAISGRIWVTDGIASRQVRPSEVPLGWRRGRILRRDGEMGTLGTANPP